MTDLKVPTCKLHPGEPYAFTFNPKDSYQCFQPPMVSVSEETRLLKFTNKTKTCLRHLQDNDIEYCVNIEISEPLEGVDLQPRLHTHGIIFFPHAKSVAWFLLYGVKYLTSIGSIEIDTISNLDYWESYCNKQQFLDLGTITNQFVCTNFSDYCIQFHVDE